MGNFLFNSKEGYDYRAVNRPHWYDGLCVIISISDNNLSWEVINTRNVDNTQLVIDHDKGCRQYNDSLCQSLTDQDIYKKKLEKECARIAVHQEIPILDHSFHDYGLMSTTKQLARYIVKYLLKRPRGRNPELSYLLKNDLRRKLMERFL